MGVNLAMQEKSRTPTRFNEVKRTPPGQAVFFGWWWWWGRASGCGGDGGGWGGGEPSVYTYLMIIISISVCGRILYF